MTDEAHEFLKWRFPANVADQADRGLRRALEIERTKGKLYERRLIELLSLADYVKFRKDCEAEAIARGDARFGKRSSESGTP